jgi:16S rRNA processing protein RimM
MDEQFAPPEFLIVGHILAPRGIKGEIKAQVVTDFPDRFTPGKLVYLDGQPLEIETCHPYKRHLLVKLATINTRQDAEDEYYAFQLIGLDVVTTEGKHVGRITDIMSTAGNDIYIVEGEGGEILIPAIEDVVKSIDLEAGKMVIEAIEGLLGPA